MSAERVKTKSKIPVKVISRIPVHIEVNKKSATGLHKTTVNQNKLPLASQDVASNKTLKKGCCPEIPAQKALQTKKLNQVKNKITTHSSKDTERARLDVKKNPSKVFNKSNKIVQSSTPVPKVKTKIKVQPAKRKNIVESHPSQPDIEFVPDEVSRKRILDCIDLPPPSNATARGQTSIYDRPSLYRLNLVRPSDPRKALMKTLQSIKDRRETFQNTCWRESINFNRPSVNKFGLKPPDFNALKTLENIDCEDWSSLKQSSVQDTFGNKCFSLARKTPKMVLEEAKKRFQEQKLKEENRSAKKVTFQVSNPGLGKENKCLVELKTTGDKQDETISKTSTPDLILRKTFWKKDETPPQLPSTEISSKESKTACSPCNIMPKKPVSILKKNIFTEMDVRRGSLFCSRPIRIGPGKMRRSVSFSNFPPASPKQPSTALSRIQVQGLNPDHDLELSSPPFRRSLSSSEITNLRSIANAKDEACNALSSARELVLKMQSLQTNDFFDKLRSSISASGLRSSLFLSKNQREVPQSKNPKLCTPVPVSFYPRSQKNEDFSPEFLCPKTSNYIIDAPIKTPLVLKNLAEREKNDDLNQVRKKLNFMPPAEEMPKQNTLAHASKQNKFNFMVDQECSEILSEAIFPYICSRNIFNPIANILENGDEMHFVPVCACP